MATFKACIFTRYVRQDGTVNVKIRLTHLRKSKLLSTNIFADKVDLTKNFKLKNQKIADQIENLLRQCREICNGLGFTITTMKIDDLAQLIIKKIAGDDSSSLEFIDYWDRKASNFASGTAGVHRTARNALMRYTGSKTLNIDAITCSFVVGFIDFLKNEPSQRGANRKTAQKVVNKKEGRATSSYIGCLKSIYNLAKDEFNDEDNGIVRLPHNPFRKLKIEVPIPEKRALSADVIQKIITIPYRTPNQPGFKRFNLAKDCFLLSFALAGMNSVDMWNCTRYRDSVITYNRTKTASRRSDRALMKIKVENQIKQILDKYRDSGSNYVFNFHSMYSCACAFNRAINKGLKTIGIEIGYPDLTFYAARHSWATIARKLGISLSDIHEALNHVDSKMNITTMYIDKDWEIIWQANATVLIAIWSSVSNHAEIVNNCTEIVNNTTKTVDNFSKE